ncbi:MAG TPA: AtpZ/AtpI family protein [Candidatus Kryptonia bacterium]
MANVIKKRSGTLGDAYRQLAPYMGLGTELAASVGGMLLVGYFLDEYFKTTPWLLLAGAVVGFIGGFYNFFREVQKLSRSDTDKRG